MAALRIATRKSRQATAQASSIAAQIEATGQATELVLIETMGDRTQVDNVPLHTIGGLGVFTKEVQRAVLDGRADLAVHSAKDLPTIDVEGLTIGAFAERRNPADALAGRSLAELAHGATVATGSVRRRAQLRRARPDLNFEELRGNIDTRLERIPDGGAIVIAVAALEILDLSDEIAQVLDPAEFVPAVGQGCVAVERRTDDKHARAVLERIDDAATRAAVMVERAFLAELGSGCSLPVGAHVDGRQLFVFLSDDASGMTIGETVGLSGNLADDMETAAETARSMLDQTSFSPR